VSSRFSVAPLNFVRDGPPVERAVQLEKRERVAERPHKTRPYVRQRRKVSQQIAWLNPAPDLRVPDLMTLDAGFDQDVVVQRNHGCAPAMQHTDQVVQPSGGRLHERLALRVQQKTADGIA